MQFSSRSCLVLFAVLALGALAFAPDTVRGLGNTYLVTLLNNPDGAFWIWANDINDSGRIVGGQQIYDEESGWRVDALLWTKYDADPVVLAPLPGDTIAEAFAINEPGQVCGYSTDGAWTMRAVVWEKDGTASDRHPDLGRYYSQMCEINQYGDATGIVYAPGYARAFISPADGEAQLLELDTGTYVQSWPYEINKDGMVVGFARVGSISGPIHACYWDEDGNFFDLHDAIEDELGISVAGSRASALSDDGAVAGMAVVTLDANNQATDLRAFVWTEDDGFIWVDNAGSDLCAIGGGSGKYFVGVVDGSLQNWYSATAAIWARTVNKGKVSYKIELLPMPEGHTGMMTWGGTTSGRLAGTSIDADGYWYAWYADK